MDSSLTSTATTAILEISFDGNQIYADTQAVPIIAPLSDSTVTFASLTPYKSGTYEIVVYTQLGFDTSNDTLSTSFEVVGDIAFNEFLPFPNSNFNNPNLAEFFEIINTTNLAVDISNWTLVNSAGQTITVGSGTISANSYFCFAAQANLTINEGLPVDYDYSSTAFVLDDVLDFLLLKNSSGEVVDSIFYDTSWSVTQGESFERENVKLDGNNVNNWCKATTTYGSGVNKGTPGDISSCSLDSKISNLIIETNGSDVVLNWIGKQGATNYKIYRSANPEFTNSTQIGTFTPNGSSPTFTDFGASQNADKYFYFVTWEN